MPYDFSNEPTPTHYEGSATPYQYSWLDKNNVTESTRNMYEGWFRDHLKLNGLNVQYARIETNFAKKITDAQGNIDWAQIDFDPIYMEKPNAEYYEKEALQILFENNTDQFLYEKFMGGRKSSGKIFILKRDFYEQFRYTYGTDESETVDITVEIPNDIPDVITGVYETIPWAVSYVIPTAELSEEALLDGISFTSVERHFNQSAAWSLTYPAVENLSVEINSVDVDLEAQTIVINITVGYKGRWYPNPTDPNVWPLAPNVKDFFVFRVGNRYEKYEVTLVTDHDLQNDGMNTLLYDYVWRCDVVRMVASYEVGTDTIINNQEKDLQKLIDEAANKETEDAEGGQQNPFYGGNGDPEDWNNQILG